MEIWFIAAVLAAVLAGVSNFYFKIAASRGYNAEVFILYGGLSSSILIIPIALILNYSIWQINFFTLMMTIGGIIASLGGIMKVYALRHVDSTIFFPLFKLLSPGLAIIFGIIWFNESFTSTEWLGMVLGLTVPLMLITKAENGRQNNLKAGLIFVLLTALVSALAAAVGKFVIDSGIQVLVALFYSSVGVFIGTLITIIFKQGFRPTFNHIKTDSNFKLILHSSLRSIFISLAFYLVLYAYTKGGTLGIVQTIHSLYILIPIILSIIFYNEHWNLQKAIAITLSILSLALLG
ncbi:MAG: EamA family transporter [Candidatus Nomurabacteria bacterium]|nr:MAG: EamA family transporter [Candidatus Nomurabacteria bacterium]